MVYSISYQFFDTHISVLVARISHANNPQLLIGYLHYS
ncbi:MAG: hypothetical protein ACJA0V_003960 [Planctomycetota bacterium]|jgi:hypothetical protein